MIENIIAKVAKLRTNLNIKRTLQLVLSLAKGWTVLSVILIFVETGIYFASLYVFKRLIDVVAHPAPEAARAHADLLNNLIVLTVVSILYIVAKSLSGYITETQAMKVGERIDNKIHTRAMELDLEFYESPDYFDVLKRAREAGAERPNAVVHNLVDIAKNLMMSIGLASVIVSINWLLLPLMILFVIPTLFVRIRFADKLNAWRIKRTPLDRQCGYYSYLLTSENHAKEIRAFNIGEHFRNLYSSIRIDLLGQWLSITGKRTINEIFTSILAALGFLSCIAFIAFSAINGENSVGDITIFLFAFLQAFGIMQSLSSNISQLYLNNIYVSNLFQFFDLKGKQKDPETALTIPNEEKLDLRLEGVSFSYPHADRPTLRNINMTIASGKIIAIVGLNGAGKSTLIKLLCRLYDPTEGRITLGGTDIREFGFTDYRKQISTVFQDFGHYNITAAENIRLGDIDGSHSDSRVVEAAQNAGANQYIEKFPLQYNTMMGRIFEDGHEVSIGQWQRLAIARSFYRPSRFIILDEATSAQDFSAELELLRKFRGSIGKRAAVIISHRPSAIRHADYIYVLADGEIKQAGTHEDLIMVDGEYSRLFRNAHVDAV